MITTSILADSISPHGHRITTALWTYPRYLHAEVMTHRCFARNAASSRAIPISKFVEAVSTNPATFEQYGAANKGMSAQTLMAEEQIAGFLEDWTNLAHQACRFAETWDGYAAKQLVNRALEPWMHMTTIVTATEWSNFFALRAHPAAQPEFQVLAYRFLDQYLKSTPQPVDFDQWHVPLVTEEERQCYNWGQLQVISTARCARVSYTRHGTDTDYEKDLALHDSLKASAHMSPFEHQATPWEDLPNPSPFRGWLQYRKTIQGENREGVDLQKIMADKPEWVTL